MCIVIVSPASHKSGKSRIFNEIKQIWKGTNVKILQNHEVEKIHGTLKSAKATFLLLHDEAVALVDQLSDKTKLGLKIITVMPKWKSPHIAPEETFYCWKTARAFYEQHKN